MLGLTVIEGWIRVAEDYIGELVKGTFVESIRPSDYAWVFPDQLSNGKDIKYIDSIADSGNFPSVVGLVPALVWALALGVVRLVFTYFIFSPLAKRAMKIKAKFVPEVWQIKQLRLQECKYRPSQKEIEIFCAEMKDSHLKSTLKENKPDSSKENWVEHGGKKIVNLAEIDSVNSYIWNLRRYNVEQKKIVKFVEALWRFIFYLIFFVVGYYTLIAPTSGGGPVSWINDTMQHWAGWPLHELPDVMRFYYQIQLGCYLHQLMWTEVSRSDAAEMIIHHLTTILLLTLSFLTNYTRVGTTILFLHDAADIFLESAKLLNYTSKAKGHGWAKQGTDIIFTIFAITFFVTRLVIYPKYILYSVWFEASVVLGTEWIGYWIFLGLLMLLQCLHIFWFYLVAKMIYRLVTSGIEKDERSDDEEDFEKEPSWGDKDKDNSENENDNDDNENISSESSGTGGKNTRAARAARKKIN